MTASCDTLLLLKNCSLIFSGFIFQFVELHHYNAPGRAVQDHCDPVYINVC